MSRLQIFQSQITIFQHFVENIETKKEKSKHTQHDVYKFKCNFYYFTGEYLHKRHFAEYSIDKKRGVSKDQKKRNTKEKQRKVSVS